MKFKYCDSEFFICEVNLGKYLGLWIINYGYLTKRIGTVTTNVNQELCYSRVQTFVPLVAYKLIADKT